MISIQLPDGSRREYPAPLTVAEVAASIGTGLAKAALGGKVGQGDQARLVDTSYLIEQDTALAIVTEKDAAGLELLSRLSVGEDYLIASRIPLGTLLDLVAGFLDALDMLYGVPVPAIEPGPMFSARALHATGGRSLEPGAIN